MVIVTHRSKPINERGWDPIEPGPSQMGIGDTRRVGFSIGA